MARICHVRCVTIKLCHWNLISLPHDGILDGGVLPHLTCPDIWLADVHLFRKCGVSNFAKGFYGERFFGYSFCSILRWWWQHNLGRGVVVITIVQHSWLVVLAGDVPYVVNVVAAVVDVYASILLGRELTCMVEAATNTCTNP